MKQILRPAPPVYELKEIIGQGSNGCVYRAVRADVEGEIRHEVAIKLLNSRNSVDIWREEFKSLAQIQSSRCVRVFGFEWMGQRPALVLEYIEGVSLSELIREVRLSETELNWIGQEIALGLRDLNQHGLCHGDLSPNNIMINTSGEVRLLDFGLGNGAKTPRRLTRAYAAPEVLLGQPATKASDLWSLGRILREAWPPQSPLAPWVGHLLNYSPEERIWIGPRRSRPAALGNRVRRTRRRMQESQGKTCEVSSPDGFSSTSVARWSRPMIWPVLILFLLFNAGADGKGRTAPLNEAATLRLRSNFGVQIGLNGRLIGYLPQDLTRLTPGIYHLSWVKQGRRGQRTLTLKAGDHILLDDRVFSTP